MGALTWIGPSPFLTVRLGSWPFPSFRFFSCWFAPTFFNPFLIDWFFILILLWFYFRSCQLLNDLSYKQPASGTRALSDWNLIYCRSLISWCILAFYIACSPKCTAYDAAEKSGMYAFIFLILLSSHLTYVALLFTRAVLVLKAWKSPYFLRFSPLLM